MDTAAAAGQRVDRCQSCQVFWSRAQPNCPSQANKCPHIQEKIIRKKNARIIRKKKGRIIRAKRKKGKDHKEKKGKDHKETYGFLKRIIRTQRLRSVATHLVARDVPLEP